MFIYKLSLTAGSRVVSWLRSTALPGRVAGTHAIYVDIYIYLF